MNRTQFVETIFRAIGEKLTRDQTKKIEDSITDYTNEILSDAEKAKKTSVNCDKCVGIACGDECDGKSHFVHFENRSSVFTDVIDIAELPDAENPPVCEYKPAVSSFGFEIFVTSCGHETRKIKGMTAPTRTECHFCGKPMLFINAENQPTPEATE